MTAEPDLAAHLERHANHLLARLPEDELLDRVVDAVTRLMEEGEPLRVEAVAQSLALSKRSLQRRLHEHDTNFQGVVDGVRQRTALTMLSDTDLSLDECALRLGFANVSAFRRAFVRWVGTPPGQVRRDAGHLARSG